MLFVSTRGQVDKVSSAHAIKEGLAGDGGLFVPQSFPYLSQETILGMHTLPYEQCAAKILGCFLTDYSSNGPMYWNYGMALQWRLRILPCRSYLI